MNDRREILNKGTDYPDLEGDEARRSIWIVDVPLAATHHLRNSINTGKSIPREILERYEIPIVASVLKLYLLELPGIQVHSSSQADFAKQIADSLVSSQVYEIIKTIYSSPDSSTSTETRISVLQNTLGQLRLANIATLDAITTHFTRLIELTSADEPFVASLAQTLAPCILRPRIESSLTMHERHSYRLIRDLFDHKEEIFGELKRASSQNHSLAAPASNRPRAPSSTDESNRRANMEARNRAIASKARASSPAPSGMGINGRTHRRDRSTGAETRFPIQTSPTAVPDPHRRGMRHSLDVPEVSESPSTTEPPSSTNNDAVLKKPITEEPATNGTSEHVAQGSTPQVDDLREGVGVEKQNSLGRSGAVAAAANRIDRMGRGKQGSGSGLGMIARQSLKRDSAGSLGDKALKRDSMGSLHDQPRGVELSDKPMDF